VIHESDSDTHPLAAARASEAFCLAAEQPKHKPLPDDWEAKAAADWFATRFELPRTLARALVATACLGRTFR
jgi:hypothetical protein